MMMIRRLRLFFIFLAAGILAACDPPVSSPSIRAAYLVQPGGQLSAADLAGYPEILVTGRFEEFQQAARRRVALWIDRNAIQLVEEGWLDEMPQASYPIVLVGYNYPYYAFGLQLGICCFLGHFETDHSGFEPGFSVIKRDSGDGSTQPAFLQGFKEIPSVDAILRISNDLLDGKIVPTPSRTPPPGLVTSTPLPMFPGRSP